jgi:hypothetical protein
MYVNASQHLDPSFISPSSLTKSKYSDTTDRKNDKNGWEWCRLRGVTFYVYLLHDGRTFADCGILVIGEPCTGDGWRKPNRNF